MENLKKFLPGEVFNSASLPSGNLVDGLPIDLHSRRAIRMQLDIDCHYGPRFFMVGHVKMLWLTNNVVVNIKSVSFRSLLVL